MAQALVDRFLKQAVNHTERKFWIARTYRYLELHWIIAHGSLSIPRALRSSPHLDVVAKVWELEGRENRSPTEQEIREFWYDRDNERRC